MKSNKKYNQIKPLPKGSLEFLKRFRDSDKWELVPPQRKGIITRSINKRIILNNKHLKIINEILRDLKGINNILDVSNSRLVYRAEYKKKIEPKRESAITKTNYPFDVHWRAPKGNTPKQNWNLYTKSGIWKAKRNYILEKRGNRCQDPDCSQPIRKKSKLHCHHLTYVRFGREEENDLQILCETCHNKAHRDKTIKEMQEEFELSNWVDGIELSNPKTNWRLETNDKNKIAKNSSISNSIDNKDNKE